MKQKIRKDLRNGKSIDNVCREYGISFKDLVMIMFEPDYMKKKMLPEHIVWRKPMYCICNDIDGKTVYFGSFRALHQAKAVLKRLKNSNWSIRPYEYLGMMYVYPRDNGNWQVRKNIGNGSIWQMIFENKDDAIFVRDELILCDWNLSCLPEILEKVECEGSGDYC